MQIIIHGGLHCTDEDRLLRCLLRNTELLRQHGTAVPGPSRYRTLLSDVLNALADAQPHPDARDAFLDAVLDEETGIDRLVLSHPNLFSVPKLAFGGGVLYARAEARLKALCTLFPDDDVQLYLGLRDFASFVPALHAATPHADLAELLDGADPMALRWYGLVRRLRAAVPGMPITLWCNEDTPLIWGALVRDIGGLAPGQQIRGAFDLFAEIVEPEGMRRFRAFMRDHPHLSEDHKRRLMIAFLDKYARDDLLEEEFDLPGWDAGLIAALSEAYDADVAQISDLDGVRLIAP